MPGLVASQVVHWKAPPHLQKAPEHWNRPLECTRQLSAPPLSSYPLPKQRCARQTTRKMFSKSKTPPAPRWTATILPLLPKSSVEPLPDPLNLNALSLVGLPAKVSRKRNSTGKWTKADNLLSRPAQDRARLRTAAFCLSTLLPCVCAEPRLDPHSSS